VPFLSEITDLSRTVFHIKDLAKDLLKSPILRL